MKSNTIQLIKALSEANGISGFESEVIGIVREKVSGFLSVEEDKIHNLYLHKNGNTQNRPVVLVDAHTDEVGFMVQSIKANGMICFLPIGGWIPQVVVAQKLRIKNKNGQFITGIVSSKPPHFTTDTDNERLQKIHEMTIDIGATSSDEVIDSYGIEPGAPIVPDVKFSYDPENDIMLGKALDNRLGCAAVIETLIKLDAIALKVDMVGTLTSQEEIGTRGIEVVSKTIDPDVAIIFEGTPADDTFDDIETPQGAIKKGPQIRHLDQSLIANPQFVRFAKQIGMANGISIQEAVRRRGSNNGGKLALSKNGVPVIVIGIPVRYAHTPYGFACGSDYDQAVKWCCHIIKNLDAQIIHDF